MAAERRNLRIGEDPTAYLQEQFGQAGVQFGGDLDNPTPEQSANMLDAIYYGAYGGGQNEIANGDLSGLQNVAQNGLAPTQGPGQYNQFEGGYTDESGQYHLGPSQWEHDSEWAESTSYNELMQAGNPSNARTWVKQQYMAGNLSAEEAQHLENQAFEAQFGGLTHSSSYDWGEGNTLSSKGFVTTTYTPTDYSTLAQDPSGWSRSTNQVDVERTTTQDLGGQIFKAIMTSALTAGAGGALAGAGLSGTALGAAKGAIGGATSGLINEGSLDPMDVLTGALTGGLGASLNNPDGMLGGLINTGSDLADDAIKGALLGAVGGAVDGDIVDGALYGAAGGAATNLIGKGFDKLNGGGSDTSEWDFASGDGWEETDLLNMDLAADDYLNSPLFVGPNASLAGYDPNRAIPFDDPRFDPTLDINSDGVLDADDLQEIDTSHLQTTYEQNEMSYVTSITGDVKMVDGEVVKTSMDYYSVPGDDNNLYFEDGSIAATRDADGRWDIMDRDGNVIMNQSEAELGWTGNSGQINVQDQTAQNILSNSEQVIRNPDTGEYMTVGGGLDAVPAARDEYGYYLVRTDEGRLYITDGYAIEPYQGDNYSYDDPLVNDGIERMYNEKGYTWQHVQAGGTLPNGQGPNNPAVEVDFSETTDPITKTEQPEVETETTDSSPESTPTNSTDKTEKGGSSNAGSDGTPSQDVGPSNPTVPSDYVLVGVNSSGERVYENVITNIRVPESELPGEVYAGEPEGDPEVETEPTTNQEEGATGTSDTAEQGGGQNAEQDNGRGGTNSGDDAGDGNSDGNDLGEEGENDGIGDDDDEGKGADDEGSGDPGIGDGTGGSGGGGLGEGLLAGLGGGGSDENYVWQPIAGLTKISPYQKRRHAIYNSLNEGLLKAALQERRRA